MIQVTAGIPFHDDKEKMRDFKILTKEEFLKSYSYLTEADYTVTERIINMLNNSSKNSNKLKIIKKELR